MRNEGAVRHFSKNDIGDRPIILWGGGLYGEIAWRVITDVWNGKIEAVVDNKYSRAPWYNGDLMRSEKLRGEEYSHADILICAANAFQTIYEALGSLGEDIRIFDLRNILLEYKNYYKESDVPVQSPYLYGDIDIDEICLRYNYYAGEDNGYCDQIYLPYCVLCITTKCSLRCKNCAAFITHYKPQKDYSLGYIKKNFGLLLEALDGIQELELMGGEPFLHSDFDAVLQWCIEQDKIHAVKIVTNGTVMPKETTWQIMKHNKVKLVIDNYGELSRAYAAMISRARESGVRYEEQNLQIWYQLEPIVRKDISEKDLKKIYHNCNFKTCIGMTNGRFYHCNVAGHMNTAGLLSDQESDYVQLENMEWSREELRDAIRELLAIDYLKACDYCNYPANIEIPVAEQVMERVENKA